MDTSTDVQQVRREAIRRRLAGERACDIYRDLGQSRSWFDKWWAHYRHTPQTDFANRSRAPHNSPMRMPAYVAHAIVQVRRNLEAAACGLIGAPTIQDELVRLALEPIPSTSFIQEVLAAEGLTHPRGVSAASAYYPELVAWAPNAIQATDIITRWLHGGVAVQNFHTFDHYSHAVHLSQDTDKRSHTACAHLLGTCRI
jgi:hypothetical protein